MAKMRKAKLKKYRVVIREFTYKTYNVEAESASAACEMGQQMHQDGKTPDEVEEYGTNYDCGDTEVYPEDSEEDGFTDDRGLPRSQRMS